MLSKLFIVGTYLLYLTNSYEVVGSGSHHNPGIKFDQNGKKYCLTFGRSYETKSSSSNTECSGNKIAGTEHNFDDDSWVNTNNKITNNNGMGFYFDVQDSGESNDNTVSIELSGTHDFTDDDANYVMEVEFEECGSDSQDGTSVDGSSANSQDGSDSYNSHDGSNNSHDGSNNSQDGTNSKDGSNASTDGTNNGNNSQDGTNHDTTSQTGTNSGSNGSTNSQDGTNQDNTSGSVSVGSQVNTNSQDGSNGNGNGSTNSQDGTNTNSQDGSNGTGSSNDGTNNSQDGTNNSQDGSNNSQDGSNNSQDGTNNSQDGSNNSQDGTNNSQDGSNTQDSQDDTDKKEVQEKVLHLLNSFKSTKSCDDSMGSRRRRLVIAEVDNELCHFDKNHGKTTYQIVFENFGDCNLIATSNAVNLNADSKKDDEASSSTFNFTFAFVFITSAMLFFV